MMLKEDFRLILFCCLVLMVNVELTNGIEMIEIVNNIIKYSFEDSHCIYFIRDSAVTPLVLIQALIEIQIPTITLTLDNATDYQINCVLPECNGFVIASQNIQLVTRLFEETGSPIKIKPHKRTLIFFNGPENINHPPIEYAAVIKGIDIVTIKGLENDLSFHSNNLIDSIMENRFLQVTFLRTNTTLIYRNYTGTVKFNKSVLDVTTPWIPRFEYNSATYNMNISVFNYRPYILCDSENGVNDGIEYHIIKDLIKDWPVQFIVMTETLPGMDEWRSLLTHVTNKSSTIALGAHWLYTIEDVDTDMSVPYGQSCVTFLVPKPKVINAYLFILQPLSLLLWLCIIVVSVFIAIILHLTAVCYKEIRKTIHPYINIGLTIFEVISSCTISSIHYLHTTAGVHLRILLLILCIHSLMFITFYLTGYASVLTYPRFSKPIRTFNDMVTSKIHWECKNAYYDFILRNSTFPVFNQLADLQDFNKSLQPLNYRIRHDNIALATETADYGYIKETETFDDYAKLNLKLLRSCFFTRYVIMRIVKNSPFTQLINKHITRVFENGLVQLWNMEIRDRLGERYLSNFYTEFATEVVPRSPLSMKNMQGGFYLLLIGYFVATIIFLIEWKILNKELPQH